MLKSTLLDILRTFNKEQLKNFGLTDPKVKLEVKLKNGQSHKIELGDKDFSGSAVYAKIDGG